MKLQIIGFFALIFSFARVGHAQTQVMFSKDQSKATVLMLAMSSNPDAVAFNKALSLPVQDQNGKATKQLKFMDSSGKNPLDLACAFSKMVPGTGSCFVVFHNVSGVRLNPSARTIEYRVEGADAQKLAKAFVLKAGESQIFKSSDGQFVVGKQEQGGTIQALRLTYGR